jgi:hypothetical protein
MSPEAQRIAIAESVGIHLHDGDHAPSNYTFVTDLPDYLNDLNAMHEVEKTMLNDTLTLLNYARELRYLVNSEGSAKNERFICGDWHATAAQRSEAYLRTIGKWEGGSDDR